MMTPIGDIEDAKATDSTHKTTTYDKQDSSGSIGFGSGANGDLVWSGINLKLLDKKGRGDVKLDILKDVWGKAEVGKTTAIMGASGAGSKFLCFLVAIEKLPRTEFQIAISRRF